jgi:hypothetical protein
VHAFYPHRLNRASGLEPQTICFLLLFQAFAFAFVFALAFALTFAHAVSFIQQS